MPSIHRWTLAAPLLALACSGGAPTQDKPPAKAEAAEPAKAEPTADAAKTGEPAAAKPTRRFDVTHDKSGVLARTAAVLETEEALDLEPLRELSHHAEKMPSVEAVCKHVIGLRGGGEDISGCVKDTEHWIVQIGPDIYGEFAACLLEAKTPDELDACEAAEKEIEVELHNKPRGEALSKETCDGLFDHFEKLAIKEAGDQGKLVEGILEEVRADVIVTCMEQGTKAEVECAMKAKTMPELNGCSPGLL